MCPTTQLAPPDAEKQVLGRFTLARFILCEAAAATPVASTDIEDLVSWSSGDPNVKFSSELFSQGSGNESTVNEIGHTWPLTLDFHKGAAWDRLAALRGVTLGTSDDAGMPMVKQNDFPAFILEMIVREHDNSTHLGSVIIPDFIIDSIAWDHPMDDSLFQIKGHTRRVPTETCAGSELVYDVFTGDASTTDFTQSASPLNITTASNWNHLSYDDYFYIKEKASTASTGTLKKTGYSLSGVTLSAATAPATDTLVQTLYLKKT